MDLDESTSDVTKMNADGLLRLCFNFTQNLLGSSVIKRLNDEHTKHHLMRKCLPSALALNVASILGDDMLVNHRHHQLMDTVILYLLCFLQLRLVYSSFQQQIQLLHHLVKELKIDHIEMRLLIGYTLAVHG